MALTDVSIAKIAIETEKEVSAVAVAVAAAEAVSEAVDSNQSTKSNKKSTLVKTGVFCFLKITLALL